MPPPRLEQVQHAALSRAIHRAALVRLAHTYAAVYAAAPSAALTPVDEVRMVLDAPADAAPEALVDAALP